MKSLTLKSFAKLNLVLDVLGKRPDGFHQLRTIFERISLHDTIILKKSTQIRVKCSHPHVPLGPKNLVYKIAHRLRDDFRIQEGVEIVIEKRIPVAAGLAGGSSNAATVLQGLNRFWNLKLTKKQLVNYASAVGSDVAFFLYDAPYALGEGRGEQISVLPIKTKLWHVLVTPRVKVYTKDVFLSLNLKLTKKKDDVNILLPFLRENNLYSIGSSLSNDLELAILSLKPHLGCLKRKLLDAGAVSSCFSGSGPSIYALAKSQKHAESIRAHFDKRFTQVFVVSTC
ncbi:MAG: 4-(cytidine 5'-diphospho)-2-C-methyl-D-erythritol kinase [Candidatus Omnitrophota bacterium]